MNDHLDRPMMTLEEKIFVLGGYIISRLNDKCLMSSRLGGTSSKALANSRKRASAGKPESRLSNSSFPRQRSWVEQE